MVEPILAGIETEYGLLINGRTAHTQIEDAAEVLDAYSGPSVRGWNYRYESPRADLRGFSVERLAVDPEDEKFDQGRTADLPQDVRRDHVLPTGARFYNDHGHPEYSTAECFGLRELAEHDKAGESTVLSAAQSYQRMSGRTAHIYKNNTDYQGASYGTHESYLVPRSLGFESLFQALTPMLVVRQILTGAGKVGSEHGKRCAYQISQRADFFMEPANLETLYRRPVFNTRDECHANPAEWIRLHVITCDANRMPSCTARRVGLVKLALQLAKIGEAPSFKFADPVRAFDELSKDDSFEFRIPLQGTNWTTAYEVLEAYLSAAEHTLDLDPDLRWTIGDARVLMELLRTDFVSFSRRVDWAGKRRLLEVIMKENNLDWRDPALASYDLAYHLVEPEESLYDAWDLMGEVDHALPPHLEPKRSRGYARGLAVQKFPEQLASACWRSLTFRTEGVLKEVELPPDRVYSPSLEAATDLEGFLQALDESQT